jgi:hypothetical protein
MSETTYNNDISGLANINELYESSLIKKWIKLIPTDKTIPFDEYNRKHHFIPIADIVLDSELFTSGKKQGNKKRASSVYTRVQRGLYFPSEKTGLRMKTDYTPF